MRVDEQGGRVGPVAEIGEPLRVTHDDVELVAVRDEIALAVCGGVDDLALDLDAAERQAEELAGEFVMVSGNEHHARSPAHLAQKLLHDVVVRLRPIPSRAQPPAVDDVADQVNHVSLDMPQHVENEVRLATARSQMQIREEQRAVAMGPVMLCHVGLSH